MSPATSVSIVVMSSPSPHRVSTAYPHIYPQKNRGVTGNVGIRYAPIKGNRLEECSQLLGPGEGARRLARGEARLGEDPERERSNHALGLRDARRIRSRFKPAQRK